jgi:iron complex transport system permease protein
VRLNRKKWLLAVVLLLFILFFSIVAAVNVGPIDISFLEIAHIIILESIRRIPYLGDAVPQLFEPLHVAVVMDLRLPRILAALFVGMALASAGQSMQSLFRNPMADPFIIGVSAGAAFGAIVAIVAQRAYGVSFGSIGDFGVPAIAAFFAGLGAVFIVYRIAKVGNTVPVGNLLLAGVAVSALFSALTYFCIFFFLQNRGNLALTWMVGSLGNPTWGNVLTVALPTILGVGVLFLFSRDVNAILTGEETAQYLGIDVEGVKKIILGVAALMTSVAVAVAGIIGFVGLIVPHIMRLIVGADQRILIPTSALAGAIFLLWCDVGAQELDLRVAIVTSLFGAPFFIYLLLKHKREVNI